MSGNKTASDTPLFVNSMRTSDNMYSEFWRQRVAKEKRASFEFTQSMPSPTKTPLEATDASFFSHGSSQPSSSSLSPTKPANYSPFICDLDPHTMRSKNTKLPPIKVTASDPTLHHQQSDQSQTSVSPSHTPLTFTGPARSSQSIGWGAQHFQAQIPTAHSHKAIVKAEFYRNRGISN